VAFALIKTEGLDDASRTRITREAQAMGRLGSHPHIVTVFDLGEHEGQPYMVTELMGGGDVEGVIKDAPDLRLPLDQAIDSLIEAMDLADRLKQEGIDAARENIAKLSQLSAELTQRSQGLREGAMDAPSIEA
jgi:hypothetical protein